MQEKVEKTEVCILLVLLCLFIVVTVILLNHFE